MKDDTVRRLQALEDEYTFSADPAGERHDDPFDDFVAEYAALESIHGDAA